MRILMMLAVVGMLGTCTCATEGAAADVKVLSTTALTSVLQELAPQFERTTGHKLSQGGSGGLVGDLIVKGDADIGVQQIPELMAVSGIDIVGPLPGDLQNVTRFSAGIPVGAKEPEAGKALIGFLRAPASLAVFKAKGLEPD